MQGKISLEGYTPAKMAAQAALSWHQVTPSRRFVCDISLVGSPPSVLHVKSKQESTSRSTNAGTKSSQTPERNRYKCRNEIVTNSGTKSSQMPEKSRKERENQRFLRNFATQRKRANPLLSDSPSDEDLGTVARHTYPIPISPWNATKNVSPTASCNANCRGKVRCWWKARNGAGKPPPPSSR